MVGASWSALSRSVIEIGSPKHGHSVGAAVPESTEGGLGTDHPQSAGVIVLRRHGFELAEEADRRWVGALGLTLRLCR